jgi:hypothetical protein
MCIDWYYEYAHCDHVVFQKRQRCNDYLYHGSCSVHHHEEYVSKPEMCPPCHYYRRRVATSTDTDMK